MNTLSMQDSLKIVRENYPKDILWGLRKISEKNTGNHPVDYWLIGFFDANSLKVGASINMGRLSNQDNPQGKHGWFRSSPVESFRVLSDGSGWEVETKNSTYHIRRLTSVMDVISDCAKEMGVDLNQE